MVSEAQGQGGERERTRIGDRFGVVLLLLLATMFFSIVAPNDPLAWLVTTLILSLNLMVAMLASGASMRVVRGGLALAGIGIATSTVVAITRAGDARVYLSVTCVLLTLLTMAAVFRRMRLHAEISFLTVLGAICFYVLLGLCFAFVFECVGELGSQPFFAQRVGTRSDYVYFSFVTMATVGYGDLTAQGGLGRALAATEGILGQIYLVTTVAALVSNMGRVRTPRIQRGNGEASSDQDEGPQS